MAFIAKKKLKQTVSFKFLLFIRYAILQSYKVNFTKAIDAYRFAMIVLVRVFADRVLNYLFH